MLALMSVGSPALAADDTTPPVLTSISLSTSGPYAPGSQVGYQWTATDASGIETVIVNVADEDGAIHKFEGDAVADVRQTIGSTWIGRAELDFIEVRDTSGNISFYNQGGELEFYPSGDLSTHGFDFAALGFLVGASASDGAPPVLSDFDFTPKNVDVSSGAKEVSITARVTDASGAVAPTLALLPDTGKGSIDAGAMTRISGDAKNGVYQRTVSVPTTANAGPWTVRINELSDTLGNTESAPHSHPTKLVVSGGGSDTTAPVLSEFDFTPKTVDVTTGTKSVTISARVTDDTGAAPPTLVLDSDTTTQTLGAGPMTRASGDAKNGVYTRTVIVPATAAPGSWSVVINPLTDTLGNVEGAAHTHPTKLAVTSTEADDDVPQLSEFDFTPQTVDLSAGSKEVTVTARITDATGVEPPTLVLDSDATTQTLGLGPMTNTSGDLYSRTVTIPATAAAGTWAVVIQPLSDTLGNTESGAHVHPTKLTVSGTPVGASPDAPTGVTAVPGNGSARVSWTAPADNGAPITGYTVTVSPGDAAVPVAAGQTSVRVTGLTNGTAYTFTVTATNEHGTSPASPPSPAVKPAAAPGRVALPRAVIRDGKVIISWRQPSTNGARITGYRVFVDGQRSDVPAKPRRLVARSLEPGRYKVKVAATNRVGTGRASPVLKFRVPR